MDTKPCQGEINGVEEEDATCTQPLDIIYPLSEILLADGAPAGGFEASQTSTTTDRNSVQDIIMQDSQDPDEDIKEMDSEGILLEAELKEY